MTVRWSSSVGRGLPVKVTTASGGVSVTVAETPPIEFSAFSTCARQWPHIMPSTLNLRSIVSCFWVFCIGSIRRRFSRRLLVTTLTLLMAIAAPAIIGSSRKPHSG